MGTKLTRSSRNLHLRTSLPAQDTVERRKIRTEYHAALKNFEAAARYFQKQLYGKAKELFVKLAESPIPEVAERARVHLHLCQQRLRNTVQAPPKGAAEDFYNLGIAELNARRLDLALGHLNKADKMAPNREHIRYALGAVHALQGNIELALEHLKASITLRPENRTQARRDEDFASLTTDHRFVRLTSPEVAAR